MDTRELVSTYYELANRGAWDRWCDLFADNAVIDEQLAGRVEGREHLRRMMAGFPAMSAAFRNEPVHVVVEADQAVAVSRIRARSVDGQPIEADVANYFRVSGGVITYMANFHDTAPFRAVVVG